MNRLITMDALRNCLEGIVPAGIATCSADGMPNVTYVAAHGMDQDHVALSFQFFNKTRENILANPQATVLMMTPTPRPATASPFATCAPRPKAPCSSG